MKCQRFFPWHFSQNDNSSPTVNHVYLRKQFLHHILLINGTENQHFILPSISAFSGWFTVWLCQQLQKSHLRQKLHKSLSCVSNLADITMTIAIWQHFCIFGKWFLNWGLRRSIVLAELTVKDCGGPTWIRHPNCDFAPVQISSRPVAGSCDPNWQTDAKK